MMEVPKLLLALMSSCDIGELVHSSSMLSFVM